MLDCRKNAKSPQTGAVWLHRNGPALTRQCCRGTHLSDTYSWLTRLWAGICIHHLFNYIRHYLPVHSPINDHATQAYSASCRPRSAGDVHPIVGIAAIETPLCSASIPLLALVGINRTRYPYIASGCVTGDSQVRSVISKPSSVRQTLLDIHLVNMLLSAIRFIRPLSILVNLSKIDLF